MERGVIRPSALLDRYVLLPALVWLEKRIGSPSPRLRHFRSAEEPPPPSRREGDIWIDTQTGRVWLWDAARQRWVFLPPLSGLSQ